MRLPEPHVSTWLRLLGSVGTISGMVVLPEVLLGQVATVRGHPECPECRIVLADTVWLGGLPAHLQGRLVESLVRDPETGHTYAVFDGDHAALHVFRANGSHAATVSPGGPEGSGGRISAIAMDLQGRLHVMDPIRGERLVLQVPSGTVVQRQRLEGRFIWDLVFDSSRFVAAGPIATRNAAGFPLHVYNGQGEWKLSFGVEEPAFRGDLMPLLLRRLASTGGPSFWAAPINEWRLERWTFDGHRVAELVGEREWFDPWVHRSRVRSLDRAPETFTVGLAADTLGVWMLFGIAAPEWKEALDTLRDPMGYRMIRPGGRYHDTVLELVDPVRGTLVASTRLEGSWSGFVGPGRIWRTWIDADGSAHTIVAAVGLSR